MQSLEKGIYRARFASGAADMAAAQKLRAKAFGKSGADEDSFDSRCVHVLVHRLPCETLVCCYRLLLLPSGDCIGSSYSAQFYDLAALRHHHAPLAEVGRFCMAPDCHDPNIVRVAWGLMADFVQRNSVELLFGCSSFSGTDPAPYKAVFARLHQYHLAPKSQAPRPKSISRHSFSHSDYDERDARAAMPPLLRTYLAMGGWVSDHAVIDAGMNTLHVFTAVPVASIPTGRARLLRALAEASAPCDNTQGV